MTSSTNETVTLPPTHSDVPGNSTADSSSFHWTAAYVAQSVFIFCLTGVAEIMGGWMVWVAVRGQQKGENDGSSPDKETVRKPWWYALIGSFVLICYGFLPCLQPTDSFGRLYAVYGGFFIVLAFLFGWGLDGDKPDMGDIVGGLIALAGVFIVMFWPR